MIPKFTDYQLYLIWTGDWKHEFEEENVSMDGVEVIDRDGEPIDGVGLSLVLKFDGKYYRYTGRYSSWDGTMFDETPVEVKSEEYVATRWVKA